jgi:hypothetical protein
LQCFLGRLGQVSPGETHVFYERDKVPYLTKSPDSDRSLEFVVDENNSPLLVAGGLGAAHALLGIDDPTDLQARVLNALILFSRGVALPGPQDRLLHALTSVESLLLANETEPVQTNLGLRMAFLIGSKPWSDEIPSKT